MATFEPQHRTRSVARIAVGTVIVSHSLGETTSTNVPTNAPTPASNNA